jgi:hypothetical protein
MYTTSKGEDQYTGIAMIPELLSPKKRSLHFTGLLILGILISQQILAEDKTVFWGDTHVHTSWSVDSYSVQNHFTGPGEAYRFARGIPVLHTRLQTKVKIKRPLDFMVVGDHAENYRRQINILEGIPQLTNHPNFQQLLTFMEGPRTMGPLDDIDQELVDILESKELMSYGWKQAIDITEQNNIPGQFTTFAGWEWTRNPGGNQHRIIFTPAGPESTKQFIPYSTADGENPEDLWNFLGETSASLNIDFVAMPHNSNLSNGTMFALLDSEGKPLDAQYAQTRARWEPVMEITQVKGTSEVFPELSPDDEFATFEIHTDLLIGGQGNVSTAAADYARYALMNGLRLEQEIGVNPFKVGFIGSSDTHTGLVTVEEDDFLGKTVRDTLPQERADSSPEDVFFHSWELSASGLAAAWAEENTRDSIFAAFKRREVYATSGSRISVRVFGGFNFSSSNVAVDLVAEGQLHGVPMGGDLTAAGDAPMSLLIQAFKDPLGANLDRVQVVKGWIDLAGENHEKVFNALWAGERELDADGRLHEIGSTLDMNTALYTNNIGASSLSGRWIDPEFDASQRAFYYLRVLEIPTPRHSTYDAIALGMSVEETGFPVAIQERAWTSPIWYTP